MLKSNFLLSVCKGPIPNSACLFQSVEWMHKFAHFIFFSLCYEAFHFFCYEMGEKVEWLLDSGCTDHITPRKSDFVWYMELGRLHKAEITDGKYLTIEGFGTIIRHSIMPKGSEPLQIWKVLYVPKVNKQLFSLIATRQHGSMSQTTKEGTTVSQNGKLFIIGTPKSGKLHSFDMALAKNQEEVPRVIIATLSDYTLWHRRMGHTHQHVIKHLRKKHRRWSSSNHQSTSWSLWGMWKRKVQETSFPNFKI